MDKKDDQRKVFKKGSYNPPPDDLKPDSKPTPAPPPPKYPKYPKKHDKPTPAPPPPKYP